ncbi:MAG: hypothetical protein AMXMBFR59_27770 [Rhodanobacteraceae bacterium]
MARFVARNSTIRMAILSFSGNRCSIADLVRSFADEFKQEPDDRLGRPGWREAAVTAGGGTVR